MKETISCKTQIYTCDMCDSLQFKYAAHFMWHTWIHTLQFIYVWHTPHSNSFLFDTLTYSNSFICDTLQFTNMWHTPIHMRHTPIHIWHTPIHMWHTQILTPVYMQHIPIYLYAKHSNSYVTHSNSHSNLYATHSNLLIRKTLQFICDTLQFSLQFMCTVTYCGNRDLPTCTCVPRLIHTQLHTGSSRSQLINVTHSFE